MMVKDEADIIGTSLRHLLRQVDKVIVADNGSTDGTLEILRAISREEVQPVEVAIDEEVGYYQSDKMTALANRARAQGFEWVVPCDADEIWHCGEVDVPIREWLMAQPPEIAIVEAMLFDHVSTGMAAPDTRSSPVEGMEWRRRDAAPLPKVAARLLAGLVIEQGNHGAHYPGKVERYAGLNVRHFPYRSVGQFVSKIRNGAAAYAATKLPYDMGRHWREYGGHLERGGEAAIREIFETWFHVVNPSEDETLIRDPAPLMVGVGSLP